MFRMFLVAYMAIPFLAAASSNGSACSHASSLSCPCGQCEEDCGCCAGGQCICADCVCDKCGSDDSTSLTSFTAEGKKPSCCAAGTCPASIVENQKTCCSKAGSGDDLSTLVSSQPGCACTDCPDGCEGCEDCTEGECVCANCVDEE